jgi:hypothetical protein
MEEYQKSKDMKLEGSDPIEDKIVLNEIEENAQDKANSRQVPVHPFPNMEEVQSKSNIVFSEMEKCQKSKDEEVQSKSVKVYQKSEHMKLEGADPIEDKIAFKCRIIAFKSKSGKWYSSKMEEYQKPKDEAVQSKSAEVISKMDEHHKSKEMKLELKH